MRHADSRTLAALATLTAVTATLVGVTTPAGAAPGDPAWDRFPVVRVASPQAPVLDPRSGDVFVASAAAWWMAGPSTLSRVDGRTGRVEWTRPADPGRKPGSVQVDAPRRRLVVTGSGWAGPEGAQKVSGYVAVHDLDGRELWHRTDLSPGEESRVLDVAVDDASGQVCATSANSTDVLPQGVVPTTRLTCWTAAGDPVFTQAWPSGFAPTSGGHLAIDRRSHQVLVASRDQEGGSATAVRAFSAAGEPLSRLELEPGLQVHDLLVDPRRALAHVVGRDSAGRGVVVGLNSRGAQRSRTSWGPPRAVAGVVLDATVLPRSGTMVVAAPSGGRLHVHAIEPSGRRAERTVIRRVGRGAVATIDPRDGRVLTSAIRGKRVHTSARTLEGRVLWEHVLGTRGKVRPTQGVHDPRRGRFTFLVPRRGRAQVVQLRD